MVPESLNNSIVSTKVSWNFVVWQTNHNKARFCNWAEHKLGCEQLRREEKKKGKEILYLLWLAHLRSFVRCPVCEWINFIPYFDVSLSELYASNYKDMGTCIITWWMYLFQEKWVELTLFFYSFLSIFFLVSKMFTLNCLIILFYFFFVNLFKRKSMFGFVYYYYF